MICASDPRDKLFKFNNSVYLIAANLNKAQFELTVEISLRLVQNPRPLSYAWARGLKQIRTDNAPLLRVTGEVRIVDAKSSQYPRNILSKSAY